MQPEQIRITIEKPKLKPGRILAGYQIADLPMDIKVRFADQIYQKLQANPTTMRLFKPDELVENMNEEKFVMKLGDRDELLGCAQVWPLPANPAVIEVGTWLSFKNDDYENGSGAQVMKAAAKFAMTFPEAIMAVALVNEINTNARGVLSSIGGVDIGWRPSDYVKTDGKPATMRVFNLINLVED